MAHVVATDNVRAVGQTVGMFVIGGAQQQGSGIDRAARRDDDSAETSSRLPLLLNDRPC